MKLDDLHVNWLHDPCPEDAEVCYRKTTCQVREEGVSMDMPPSNEGEAVCNITKDNFCREKGRKLSMARALEPLSREKRFEIWKAYFSRSPKYSQILKNMKLNTYASRTA